MTDAPTYVPALAVETSARPFTEAAPAEPPRKAFAQTALEGAARDAARAAEILAEVAVACGDQALLRDRETRRAFHGDAAEDVTEAVGLLLGARKGARGARFLLDASAQDRIPPATCRWPDHPALDLARLLLPSGTGDEIEEAAALITARVEAWRS